eukprot:g16926.t1
MMSRLQTFEQEQEDCLGISGVGRGRGSLEPSIVMYRDDAQEREQKEDYFRDEARDDEVQEDERDEPVKKRRFGDENGDQEDQERSDDADREEDHHDREEERLEDGFVQHAEPHEDIEAA